MFLVSIDSYLFKRKRLEYEMCYCRLDTCNTDVRVRSPKMAEAQALIYLSSDSWNTAQNRKQRVFVTLLKRWKERRGSTRKVRDSCWVFRAHVGERERKRGREGEDWERERGPLPPRRTTSRVVSSGAWRHLSSFQRFRFNPITRHWHSSWGSTGLYRSAPTVHYHNSSQDRRNNYAYSTTVFESRPSFAIST